MNEERFWEIISDINQDVLDISEEEAVSPLLDSLCSLTEKEVFQFKENLSRKLYDIDGEEYLNNSGESSGSSDGFLYSRCYVVARGREFYKSILTNPSLMPKSLNQWCEPLLYVASEAWSKITGKDINDCNYRTSVSYETGSNDSLWKSIDHLVIPEEYDTENDFTEKFLARAVARAGHEYKYGEYEHVISLLQPHESMLSKKQRRMLEDAKSKLKV